MKEIVMFEREEFEAFKLALIEEAAGIIVANLEAINQVETKDGERYFQVVGLMNVALNNMLNGD